MAWWMLLVLAIYGVAIAADTCVEAEDLNDDSSLVQVSHSFTPRTAKLLDELTARERRLEHWHQNTSRAKTHRPSLLAKAFKLFSRKRLEQSRRRDEPHGSDIWNSSIEWVTLQIVHPAGVISNVEGGKVKWADVSYLDLNMLLVISLVAYPAIFLALLYACGITVAILLVQRSDVSPDRLQLRCYLPNIDNDDFVWTEDGIQRQTSRGSNPSGSKAESNTLEEDHSVDDPPLSARENALEHDEGVLYFQGYPRAPNMTLSVPSPFGKDYGPPILARDDLTSFSQMLYSLWAYFCCLIPSLMVFGLPSLLMLLSISYPMEVCVSLSMLVSALVVSNGIYMSIFCTSSLLRMRDALNTGSTSHRKISRVPSAPHSLQWLWPEASDTEEEKSPPAATSEWPSESALRDVHHWVILPQYKEDIDVVAMAMKSISESALARTNISVLLAMEEREAEGQQKGTKLREEFKDLFEEVCISYHPVNLPNDPPGKASNLKWAADCLLEHLSRTRSDLTKIVVTVADADSDFHHKYFSTLSTHYLEAPPEIRNLRIWQSPIFHLKNYYRQPSPVIVGTMFTTMQELSMLADPNSIRFPYSTYSLSLELVRRVGGWDAEWIAEDWHMGIKCYLLTVGHCCVEPIMLPTLNYTPEDSTWYTTLNARWAQAKRHALGFSDVSYYFMMLPLIFGHALSKTRSGSEVRRIKHLRAFWGMAMHGVTVLIRLVNVHVVIGVMASYGALNLLIRAGMHFFMDPDRHVDLLWQRTAFVMESFFVSTAFFMAIVTLQFHFVYQQSKHRVDELPANYGPWSQYLFKYDFVHWLYTAVCFMLFGPFFFFFLGVATWRAAIKMVISPVFEYEVAAKPKPVKSERKTEKDV